MKDLRTVTEGSPYQGYLYSYPHKTSYRPFEEVTDLTGAWSEEDLSQLYLYMHIPFCEMRCGFCNLFTSAKPKGGTSGDFVKRFLDALHRQALQVQHSLPEANFSRLALGGGTPTYLEPPDLERVCAIATEIFGVDLQSTPISVESSPETADLERLKTLREHHVNRISIGVQSFVDQEVRGVGRAQTREQVCQTLSNMRELGFPVLNIDLMYGLPGQTQERWLYSLEQALHFAPEELYLYPLYVRPLTGVSKLSRSWDDERLSLYRFGRDHLRAQGYEQVSMRMFRKRGSAAPEAPVYCCQEDGMVGLGPGARSYTSSLHYSTDYAVAAKGVRGIIEDYSGRDEARMRQIDYGTALSTAEQKRRFTILSLLHIEGLDLSLYLDRFGSSAQADFPELDLLLEAGLGQKSGDTITLSDAGFERADAIGPWLHSPEVNALMSEFELR